MTKLVAATSPEELRARFELWLRRRTGQDGIEISRFRRATEGISSETLMVEVDGLDEGTASFVIRVQPAPQQQVYLDADVLAQAEAQRLVASAVAVPRVRWEEPDHEPLGAPFFVMDHVEGRVPATAPTFHAAGWVAELEPSSQHDLALNGLRSVAAINRLEGPTFAGLQAEGPGAAGLERYLGWVERWATWAGDGRVPELIAVALDELRSGRPDRPETSVSWGDCRPGNMLFGPDLGVRAVLDWELITLGPPEVDLGWWLMMDRWSTEGFGVAPLPGWPTRSETIEAYAGYLGRPVRDIAYFELLAATRYAVIGVRSTSLLIAAGVLPRDTTMGTHNQVTQLLAGLLGRPIPELSPDIARVMAALSES